MPFAPLSAAGCPDGVPASAVYAQTAPVAAEPTNLAYFASTPEV
jgi:hypothetical protein